MKSKPRKIRLTDKRKSWAESRNATLKGTPLKPNERSMQRDVGKVESEFDKMARDVSREVTKLFNSNLAKESVAMDASISSQLNIIMNALEKKWNKRFIDFSKTFSEQMVKRQVKDSSRDLRTSLEKLSGGASINTNTVSKRTSDIARASIEQSSSLIKSIEANYITEVKEGLMRSIVDSSQNFTSLKESVQSVLSDRYKIHKNKAKNLVLDQTRKAYQGITRQKMRDAGLNKAEWLHRGGSKNPRSYHKNVLNGTIFNLDEPPVINLSTGKKGYPGDEPNCGCGMIPVVEFG